ncbi:hypothetical protein JKP88DRAFT_275870 [Tribonema minus]|uniref:RGS domain-containing protein n=1 Tax=Tribonema minus TaxID=303371 RepID=A0A835Z924_9STRA|nr:hypothetical protein JKP88DRAFT_275870 [Tribonema minus]
MGLKAARVAIVTSPEYRTKYMALLSPGVQIGLSVACALTMCIGAAIIQPTYAALHTDRYCIAFRPWFCLPYFVLLVLSEYGIVYMDQRYQALIAGVDMYIVLETFVFSRKYWGGSAQSPKPQSPKCNRRRSCINGGGVKQSAVVPTERSTTSNGGRELSCWGAFRRRWATTMQVLECPPLAAAYAEHVQKALCYESLAFLAQVVQYASDAYESGDKQYEVFNAIVVDFICPNSRYEINISSLLRNQVLKVRDRNTFSALSGDARRAVFKAQATEVAKMLDQNLMSRSEEGTRTSVASPAESPRSSEANLGNFTSPLLDGCSVGSSG